MQSQITIKFIQLMHIGANNVAKFSLSVAELNSADDVTRDVTGATTTIGVCR